MVRSSALRWFQVLRAVALATYKEWAAYRSHVLVSLFVGPAYYLAQVYIWRAVFASRDVVGGLTLEETLTYYAVAALTHYLTYDSAGWNLQMLIGTGRFLTIMLRPVSHRFFALSQKIGHRLLGFWLEFIPVLLIFRLLFGIDLIPAQPFWALLSIGLGFVMTFLVNYTTGIAAFWLTRTWGLRSMFHIMNDICSGVFIPLTFFPPLVQKVLFFLPFQYATYVPIRVIIGSYEMGDVSLMIPQVVGLQALAVLAMLGVSEVLWRLGIRKFTGVGA